MWRLLFSLRTDGFHFRKQAPIGPYFADFACHHAKLVIEVDGHTHGMTMARAHDKERDAFLRGEGYTVLRFSNQEVLKNPEAVFALVSKALADRPQNRRAPHPLPNPSHKGEGEEKARLLPDRNAEIAALSDTLPLVGRAGEGGS